MQKMLVALALMAAAYFGYTEYYGVGGKGFVTMRNSGFSMPTKASRSVAGGATAAAGAIGR